MTTDTRLPVSLLILFFLGVGLGFSGAGTPPPFDQIHGLLPTPLQQTLLYVGLALVGLAAAGLTLLGAVKVTWFLVSVVVQGRDALSSLPDVDPLIGGLLAVVVFSGMVVGGVMLLGNQSAGAGADLPFVSEAFGESEPSVHGIVASDQFAYRNGSLPEYADADGDRLPDAWERAGETPEGTPLPGADPQHKDLYVQVNYASGIDPLNATEKRQVTRIWAEMPVENPDGTTGIRLHLDDAAPRGGQIDRDVTVHDSFERAFLETYYDERYIGTRGCTHYLVLFGRVSDRYDGYGMTPGYLSVVDGTVRSSQGGYSTRATILTHELLHNTVGRMGGGRTHVRAGWLHGSGGRFNASMSTPVRAELDRRGFARSPFFEHELCDAPVGASS